MNMENKKIRVVVVDDSVLMRQILSEIINGAPDLEVVAQASDPLVARDLIKRHNPDVITLDIEMPHMDGITFLEKMMSLRPMPVIMVSTLTAKGAEATLRALELGAVDYVTKPTEDLKNTLPKIAEEIRNKIRTASKAKVRAPKLRKPLLEKPVVAPIGEALKGHDIAGKIIAIGSSTGGVEAVTEILTNLPQALPPVVITQHMPEKFTASFAQRLNNLCVLEVKEAEDGDILREGHVYIAPGGKHLEIKVLGGNAICRITENPPVSGHRPSVDVLFGSVAKYAGVHAVGVILTGMGKDGSQGLLAMRQAGARTLGQDEHSCVVYGMPKAAFELGAVEKQFPLNQLAAKIVETVRVLSRKDTIGQTA